MIITIKTAIKLKTGSTLSTNIHHEEYLSVYVYLIITNQLQLVRQERKGVYLLVILIQVAYFLCSFLKNQKLPVSISQLLMMT